MKALLLGVCVVIIIVLIIFRPTRISKFTNHDKKDEAFKLFDKSGGKMSFSEMRTLIGIDNVDYIDLKSLWKIEKVNV